MLYLTKRIVPLLALGIISTIPVAQAEDVTVNRLLASQCAQCHGTNGRPVKDIESLAGEDDLYGELNEMRNKSNPDDIMEHQAMGYTDDQIRRIAAYYATISGNGGSNPGDSGGSDSGGSDSGDSDGHKRHKREEKSERRSRSEHRRSRDSD